MNLVATHYGTVDMASNFIISNVLPSPNIYIVGQGNWYGLVHALAIKTIKISEKGLQKNVQKKSASLEWTLPH